MSEMSTPMTTGRFVVPSVVSTHFHLREGDKVGDLGAGSGFFTEVLAQIVGPSGRVYACEIQKELVEKIGNLTRSKGLNNVDPLWCDLEEENGIKIADNELDVAIIVNTFFQFDEKASAVKEASRILRPGGKLFLVDWSESFGGLGPQSSQVVTQDQARTYFETAGFVYERSFDAGDHHYGLAFRKP